MTFRFLPPALEELSEAAEYYEGVAGMAQDFLNEVESSIQRILMFPEAWGRISKNCHHCHLRKFPYTIIYTLSSENEMMVVSVFHQRRRPNSWRLNFEGEID